MKISLSNRALAADPATDFAAGFFTALKKTKHRLASILDERKGVRLKSQGKGVPGRGVPMNDVFYKWYGGCLELRLFQEDQYYLCELYLVKDGHKHIASDDVAKWVVSVKGSWEKAVQALIAKIEKPYPNRKNILQDLASLQEYVKIAPLLIGHPA